MLHELEDGPKKSLTHAGHVLTFTLPFLIVLIFAFHVQQTKYDLFLKESILDQIYQIQSRSESGELLKKNMAAKGNLQNSDEFKQTFSKSLTEKGVGIERIQISTFITNTISENLSEIEFWLNISEMSNQELTILLQTLYQQFNVKIISYKLQRINDKKKISGDIGLAGFSYIAPVVQETP